jgi:hypothetical protein
MYIIIHTLDQLKVSTINYIKPFTLAGSKAKLL